MPDQSPLLGAAIRAVAAACTVARAVQQDLDELRQMTKDDRSPVTVADFAAQAVVALHLRRELGALTMVGEESAGDLRGPGRKQLQEAVTHAVAAAWPGVTSDAVLAAIDLGNHDASGDAYWTLDPVDGTKGFLRGGQYAISLAFIEGGQVTLGVLGCPNLARDFARPFDAPDAEGSLFYACAGQGAWSLPPSAPAGAPQRIRVARGRAIEEMRVCESVEAAHSRQDGTSRVVEDLNARGTPARLDSQCKYAVVARGQADAYLRLPTRADYVEKIWDHAAGKLIAEEAGALVTDIDGRPLDFSRGTTLAGNRGVVCAVPEFHGVLLAAIGRLDG